MDVRKKLVELLAPTSLNFEEAEYLADYLVKNGVTVQEWISVKDRLPELGERVICTDGDAVFEQYRVELSCVYGMWDRFGLQSPMQEVTYWMPMPNPPKGE